MQRLALIKLGGSVVTYKDKPLAANEKAIGRISEALVRLRMPAIIVHGGGSFGHYWSVKYDMHTKPASYDPHGVSIVHESMVALNQLIVNSMIKSGLNPYGLPPSVFASGLRPNLGMVRRLISLARTKVMPVTFGDVVFVSGSKYSILSGDSIMTMIAAALRPSKVVFATNVDGIYSDMETRTLLPEVYASGSQAYFKVADGSVADVTGGMQRKIREAFKIASYGMEVVMVNGLHPERIVEAAEGTPTLCTVIKKRRGRS